MAGEGGNIIRNIAGKSYKEAETITKDASKGALDFKSPKENTFYGKDGGKKFADYVIKEETKVINVNGHFYNEDGTFEGKVIVANYEGSINDVYVCNGKGEIKDTFKNRKKLDISHENFCYIAGVIKAEDSSTFESAAATTQATFNAVKFEKGDTLTMEEQGKLAAKLLSTGYSTATLKESLKDTENDSLCKNARKGLIHVLQEKKDYSEGAVLWDGIDFADRGVISARPHPKTDKDGGIHITKDLWIKFVNACEYKPDSKGIQRLYRHLEGKEGKGHDIDKSKAEALATIPFEEKKNASTNDSYNIFDFGQKKNSVWDTSVDSKGLKNVDYYETVGTGKFNKGRTLNKATTVVGRHIFWKPYKEHPNNKGYYWKGMMNHKL
nr:hypothetical protein [uncultured Flavobacterium sp.]